MKDIIFKVEVLPLACRFWLILCGSPERPAEGLQRGIILLHTDQEFIWRIVTKVRLKDQDLEIYIAEAFLKARIWVS